MKKFFSILVAVALFVTLLVPAAFAAGTATVTADKVTGKPGETVSVDVSIKNNPGFDSAKFSVTYDKNNLTLVSLDADMLNGASYVATGMINHASVEDVTGDGVLFTATFDIKDTAVSGEYTVGITVNKLSNEGQPINFSVTNGCVTVPHEHSWATEWSTDGENHWHECGCGEKKDKAAHQFQWVTDKPASASETGLKHEECIVCGYTRNEDTVIPKVGHGTFSDEWSYDANGHWHECSCGCGDRSGEASHSITWIVTKYASYEETGLKEEACSVCGYKTGNTEVIPKVIAGEANVISVAAAGNGKIDVDLSSAKAGEVVKFTVTPDEGYVVDKVTVTDAFGREVEVISLGNNEYSFVMPGSMVTIQVTFRLAGEACNGGESCPSSRFSDLNTSLWYHEATDYVLSKGLMNGIGGGKFDPTGTTSRAMIVTILWRLEGSPVVNYQMNFEDVAAGQWYTEAIRWAASEKIVDGYGNGKFGTNDAITREQLATMLYRYEQYKGGGFEAGWSYELRATDKDQVSEWAYEAMCWMNMNSIVTGDGSGTLNPKGNASRVEAAAMLMRFCELSR